MILFPFGTNLKGRRIEMAFKKGNIPWNINLTKETDERVAKYAESNTGKKRTIEQRKNMGPPKGRIPWNKDVPMREESKEKLRKYPKGSGPDSKTWKGGSPEWWARELKKIYKDCCLCHSDYILEMHHKDGDHNNNVRTNQIIICKTCHDFWTWH